MNARAFLEADNQIGLQEETLCIRSYKSTLLFINNCERHLACLLYSCS